MSIIERLDPRVLFVSAGRLLDYDFNAATAWPAATAVSSSGVAATVAQSAVGTVDVEGGTTATGAVALAVTTTSGSAWSSDLASGQLAATNTETNLGKLTLGFSLSASQAKLVKVAITSYDANGNRTGALASTVLPAAVNSYQRFSVDLSTMTPSGTGTFNPTGPFVSFHFQVGASLGWSGASTLRVDNVQYAKPAYYVSPIDGNNNDTGRTEALAFATIQKAIDVSQPGDIILLKGDVAHPFTVAAGSRNLITRGGTPAAWVTIKNYPGQAPTISTEGWSAIQVGAFATSTAAAIGYVELRGLHVVGSSAKVGTRSAPDGNYDPDAPNADQYGPYAQYLQPVDPATGMTTGGTADSRTNGNGLSVDGSKEENKPHDIRFADNLVEDCAGGGIGAGDSDRIQFENNVIRDNCYWDKYATSGISILSTYTFEGTTGSSVNTVGRLVRNNISSGNIHKQKWVRNSPTLTQYSDGNGIILDINTGYAFRTLVTNNVVFDNGGSGIHSYRANHVDIVNNTSYLNSASPYLQYGMIFANNATDVRIYNNIMVAPVANTGAGEAAEYVTGGTTPSSSNGIVYKDNVYSGGNVAAFGANAYNVANVTATPKFVLASTNSATADFRLQATSPAINLGVTTLAPALDLTGTPRYANPDSGAYEYVSPAPTAVTLAPASDTGTGGDNKTRFNNAAAASKLSFVVSGTVSGATVQLFASGVLIGSATAAGTSTTVTTDGTTALANGITAITAMQTFASAPSALSGSLGVTVDTTLPSIVGTPVINANLGAALGLSRSQVRTVNVTFSEPVLIGLSNFVLTNVTTGLPVSLSSRAVSISGNVVTLTLDQPTDAAPNRFLANGNYRLSLLAGVTDVAGNALDANGDGTPGETPTFDFFKLLSDFNGDRRVDFTDFLTLQNAFGTTPGMPSYNAACDLTGDSTVDFNDFLILQTAFNSSVPAVIPRVITRRVR